MENENIKTDAIGNSNNTSENVSINVGKKDAVKGKIIFFIIGILTGAVIATAAFFIYVKLAGVNIGGSSQQMQGGAMPEMPGGGMGGQDGETPPELPDGEGGQDGETPPELPGGEGGQDGETPPEKPDGDDGSTPPTKMDDEI